MGTGVAVGLRISVKAGVAETLKLEAIMTGTPSRPFLHLHTRIAATTAAIAKQIVIPTISPALREVAAKVDASSDCACSSVTKVATASLADPVDDQEAVKELEAVKLEVDELVTVAVELEVEVDVRVADADELAVEVLVAEAGCVLGR